MNDLKFHILPPGRLIKNELKARNESKTAFAKAVRISIADLNKLLNGKYPLNNNLAKRIESHWGISSSFLLRIESHYKEALNLNKKRLERV